MPLSYTEAKSLVNTEEKAQWLALNSRNIHCKVLALPESDKTASPKIIFDDESQTLTLILKNELAQTETHHNLTRWLLDPMVLPYFLEAPKPERKRRTRKAK